MKAVVCEKYSPPEVLLLKEMEKPVPADEPAAATGRSRPQPLGVEYVGVF